MTTEFDDLTTRIKTALEARYQDGHADGYAAALGDMLNFIKMTHGGVAHVAPKADLPTAIETLQADVPEEEWQKLPTDMVATSNGLTKIPPSLPKYLQLAYERLKTAPGITSRIARKQWGGGSNVLYQLRDAGLAEQRGSKFYAVERKGASPDV